MVKAPVNFFLKVLLVILTLLSVACAYYSPLFTAPLTEVLCLVLLLTLIPALYWWGRISLLLVLACGVIWFLWIGLTPSASRNWQPELSRAPYAERKGDEIFIHNVRDIHYRSEKDFDVRYVDKQVRLSDLSGIDVFVVYWAGKSIAHLIISFVFADREHLAFSIEARKSIGQEYSSIAGFFRNYELIYVVAEERDVIGLRTLHRQPNERVHLLRLAFFRENATKFFLSYLDEINRVYKDPQFYNTLTTNCTTQVLANAHAAGEKSRYNWKVLLSGYTPEFLYDTGNLAQNYKIEQLMQLGLVNQRSNTFLQQADATSASAYSQAIRKGVPAAGNIQATAW